MLELAKRLTRAYCLTVPEMPIWFWSMESLPRATISLPWQQQYRRAAQNAVMLLQLSHSQQSEVGEE